MNPLYTVSKARLDDGTLYGPVHGSVDGVLTQCGQDINEKWMILTNGFQGVMTCKKCIAVSDHFKGTDSPTQEALRSVIKWVNEGYDPTVMPGVPIDDIVAVCAELTIRLNLR